MIAQSYKVSLYIPCYNAERYIAGSIEGALHQTYPLDEIIVVDDGSKDKTREVASRFPVRVIRHERNRGTAAARNTGFRAARNELVASLDADCVAEPDWLEHLVPLMDGPRVGAAAGRVEEARLETVADRWRQAHLRLDWGNTRVANPPFLFGANGLHRKSVVQEVGGYDEVVWRWRVINEDGYISNRMRERGYRLIYDPSALVKHVKQDSGRSVLYNRWCWWRHGVGAYSKHIRLRSIAATFYRAHFRTMFFENVSQDIRGGRFELLGLDLLCLFYMPYCDFKLYLQAKGILNRIQVSSRPRQVVDRT
jgi:glycosyltransferase involved in cell wall biosynthesis